MLSQADRDRIRKAVMRGDRLIYEVRSTLMPIFCKITWRYWSGEAYVDGPLALWLYYKSKLKLQMWRRDRGLEPEPNFDPEILEAVFGPPKPHRYDPHCIDCECIGSWREWDFFLCGKQCMNATSRPTTGILNARRSSIKEDVLTMKLYELQSWYEHGITGARDLNRVFKKAAGLMAREEVEGFHRLSTARRDARQRAAPRRPRQHANVY